MSRSAVHQDTRLIAVRDLSFDRISRWCDRHGLAVAIRLGPGRAVVGGLAASLETAIKDPSVHAGAFTDIGVRIASHTPWMRTASSEFAQLLTTIPLLPARATVISNYTGAAARQPAQLARSLSMQIANTVLWDACMESVAERNVSCVLEVGPGVTLATMWRATFPDVPARSVDEFRSARAVSDWVSKVLADAVG